MVAPFPIFVMLVIVLLLIIIAISLNYFNLTAHHQVGEGHLQNSDNIHYVGRVNDMMSSSTTTFWKRIAVVLLICTLPLLWEGRSYEDIYLYNGLLLLTNKLNLVVWLLFITGLSLIATTSGIPLSVNKQDNLTNSGASDSGQNERIVFTLCAILGGIILNSATDFLTILLGLELQSYSVYILAASYRNYEPSEAAGLKYFLLGALSSALIFMGLAILYAYSGSTNLDTAFLMISSGSFIQNINSMYGSLYQQGDVILPYAGITLILAGVSWKVAAAPVQAWSIDVYDAVPTRTTAILSLLPKIALFSLLIRLISLVTNEKVVGIGQIAISGIGLQIVILVVALSLIVGSVAGLFQPRIKRLLAYSSVLNVGFILMGALLSNSTLDSYNPTLYIIQYIITTAAIWLCLINLANVYGTLNREETFSEITLISQLQGTHTSPKYANKVILTGARGSGQRTTRTIMPDGRRVQVSPWTATVSGETTMIAICLTALVLSTAGIPPMVGFYAKYSIILLALQSGYTSLALLAVLASIISTVYYLGVIRAIWGRSSILPSLKGSSENTDVFQLDSVDPAPGTPRNTGSTAFYNLVRPNSGPGHQLADVDNSGMYESTLFISFFSLVVVLYLLQYSVAYVVISL